QVTVVPRYCVVNLLEDQAVWLRQPGSPLSTAVEVDPGGRLPWHWPSKNEPKGLLLHTAGAAWSY
ncbi:unnamed protein product, partial [Discosporangium mesarthrocarpum]